jgi:tetratricopeptide (TPR) repeat protein
LRKIRISTWTCQIGAQRHACIVTLLVAFLFVPSIAHAQPVHAWEGTITVPTYQLGPPDPNPPFALVNAHPVYPYPMLDDLSDQRVPKSYRAIYLENQYLKITLLPELGGHVYSIYDKSHHREMLYRDKVIKYGLVGPRGAWIAGGMEFSFPFAHTTDTVSNVESALRQNADGSATAIVGAIDWVSNMYWQIMLTLRPGTARLEEGVTLFNATPLNHLYLFWTNAAVRATNDLQYIYPMRETISDDPFAIVQSWPLWKGVDQSWYKNDPSAMAIFARDVHRDFFGVYYHQSNYGVVHVSDFRQDPGKKVWSWGTARSGRIWDDILSDNDGPYNEIQSGRFATQGYREFMEPRRVEQWTEYWYPVSGLDGGFVEATGQMALNVTFTATGSGHAGEVKLLLCPVAEVRNATMTISLGPRLLRTIRDLQLPLLHSAEYIIPVQHLDRAKQELSVTVRLAQGKTLLAWSASEPVDGNPELAPSAGKPLQTPLSVTAETTLQELYLQGVFLQKKGDTQGARKIYDQVLQRDPGYVPALLQEAFYSYPAADFVSAEHLIRLAQQRENDNPMVAYAAGLVYRAEGRFSLANDAFWSTIHHGPSSTPGLSLSPAYLELGEIAIRQRDYANAVELLQRAVDPNPADGVALADLAVAERLNGNLQAAAAASAKAIQQMPLLPYALAENWLDTAAPKTAPTPATAVNGAWAQTLGSDPQTYLAVAAWYHALGAWQSSDAVLHTAIANLPAQTLSPMAYYYLASNSRQEGDSQKAAQFAEMALPLPVAEVFPNTITDAAVLTEAVQHSPQDTHAKYALGNFLFAHSRYEEAAVLWSDALEQKFDNPVLLRNLGVYQWHVKDDLPGAARYYERAIAISPEDYRLYTDLDEIYEQEGDAAARATLFHDAPLGVLGRDTVRARHALFFLAQFEPAQALALLVDHPFKPWEGGDVIHDMFVRANMEKGMAALAEQKPREAAQDFQEAMRYPENLGTGEPARPELTEQLYWMGVALDAQGKTGEAVATWQSVAHDSEKADVFSALAYRKLGQNDLARQMLQRCVEPARRPEADAQNYFVAGLAERYSGDKERAQDDFHHALALDPNMWPARVAIAEMNNPKGISDAP